MTTDILQHLRDMQEKCKHRASGFKPGDCIGINPSSRSILEQLTPKSDDRFGGYINRWAMPQILTIEEIKPGVFEMGTYAAFCAKYPEWYERNKIDTEEDDNNTDDTETTLSSKSD